MQNICINTCYYYGQNDPICDFSAGWQDLKSPWVLVGQAESPTTHVPTTADQRSYIPDSVLQDRTQIFLTKNKTKLGQWYNYVFIS